MERMRFSLWVLALGCLCLAPGVTFAWGVGGMGYAVDNGDINGDGDRDLCDVVMLCKHVFFGRPDPVPLALCASEVPSVQNGDANGNGKINLGDAIRLARWVFGGCRPPVEACDADVPRIVPPDAAVCGKSLADWMEVYWRWYYSGGGDDTVCGVLLMGLPDGELLGGDFTPENPGHLQGVLEVEVPAGMPFMLPEFAATLERYKPELGIPDDECLEDEFLLNSVDPLKLTINDVLVMDTESKEDFYTGCQSVDPPIVYPEPTDYGSIATIGFQGVGFISAGLPPGDHVIHLYEEWIMPGYWGVIYDNTWKVHVTP